MENPFKDIYRQCNTLDEPIPFPRMIDIEVTNACNMECRMCPVGTGKMKRKTGFMRPDVFLKIHEEIEKHKTPVRFIRWGEPTLHPNMGWMIILCAEAGIKIHLNTNGLQDCSWEYIDSIKFSLQGLNPKDYCKWRGRDAFYTVLRNAQRRMVDGNSYVIIGTTYDRATATEIQYFKNIAEECSDEVNIGKTMLPPYEGLTPNRDCHEVFNKLSINWDGTVSACCRDYDNMMIVGDVRKNTLQEIWQGAEMESWRERIRNGDYSHPLCKDCYIYTEMEGK